MARLGLGPRWQCLFANEWSEKKAASYRRRFGSAALQVADVASLSAKDLPGHPALVWASFPCQDLSLAGAGAGLSGRASGAFWPFWRLIESLAAEGRAPASLVLENVPGMLTSHGGRDFPLLACTLASGGYRCGALLLDAVHFLPQSRPRLFVIAHRQDAELPSGLCHDEPSGAWISQGLRNAYARLPEPVRKTWLWWRLPQPEARAPELQQLLEPYAEWQSPEQTDRLIALMSPPHLAKLAEARRRRQPVIGTLYRRTRNGVQRAEVRLDGVAGCLRTPSGGSSRQTLLLIDGESIRSRLLTPRETARLMGVPDDYTLPASPNDAYHLFGDGVAVPVVRWLDECLLSRLCP